MDQPVAPYLRLMAALAKRVPGGQGLVIHADAGVAYICIDTRDFSLLADTDDVLVFAKCELLPYLENPRYIEHITQELRSELLRMAEAELSAKQKVDFLLELLEGAPKRQVDTDECEDCDEYDTCTFREEIAAADEWADE